MKLPVFKNKIELEKTNWKHYLNYIYGDIPDNKFPIDINQFDILYTNLIDKYNIELTEDCIINNNYDNLDKYLEHMSDLKLDNQIKNRILKKTYRLENSKDWLLKIDKNITKYINV